LSAVSGGLFNIFAAYAPYLEAVFSIRNLRTLHAMCMKSVWKVLKFILDIGRTRKGKKKKIHL